MPAPAEALVLLEDFIMLHYALIFLVVALVAGVLGFGGVAVISVEIARLLFFIFLILFAVSLIAGLLRRA